ncbi:MAG: spondin domain-containing protein [Myxococcales bacterium]|nr:spondin domain-containing protein [Myxococcales bacterium]
MKKTAVMFTALAALAACGDADEPELTPDAGATTDAAPTPTTFTVRVDNVAPWTVLKAGLASTKLVATPGPLASGEAYDFTFTAGRGQALSFATMFGESNDWFFAPGPAGIALYDGDGAPVSGDVTAQVELWNAGTELDQEPAVGDSTGPRQSGPDAGAPDPDPTVRSIPVTAPLSSGVMFTRPAIDAVIRVTVTPGANRQFTVRLQNVSTATTLVTSAGSRDVHLSPAVWALHAAPGPLFTPGAADRAQGLEQVAESGRGAGLVNVLGVLTGVATPASPLVWAVHRGGTPLYDLGVADRGDGLERLAERGDPQVLADSLDASRTGLVGAGVLAVPVGAAGPGPARPGQAYEAEISALPGDRLSFATMFGMSNDWFFASDPAGIMLFNPDGSPMSGDVTHMVGIYDAGTELDEELGIGPNTAPQQATPDSGAPDPIRQVRAVGARYPAPASAHLRVTLTPR